MHVCSSNPTYLPLRPRAERARCGIVLDESDWRTSEAGRKYFAEAPDPQVPWPCVDADGAIDEAYRHAVCDYYALCERAAYALCGMFEAALALAPGTFSQHMRNHVTTLNCYSGKAPAAAAERFPRGNLDPEPVLGAHGDATIFTLLSHGGDPGDDDGLAVSRGAHILSTQCYSRKPHFEANHRCSMRSH